MGWDQVTDHQTPTTSSEGAKTDSLHSVFVSDILSGSSIPITTDVSKTNSAPIIDVASNDAPPIPQRVAVPQIYSNPRAVIEAAPTYAAPSDMQYGGNPVFSAPPAGERPGSFYGGGRPPQVRDMTYRGMSRSQMLAQALDNQQAARDTTAALGRGRPFQPQPVAQQPRRPEVPPGAPQEQPRQRLFRGLFRGGDQPAAQPKNEPMQKLTFNANNETGVVGEMTLPTKFKEIPKDPNLAPGEDPIKREYQSGNSRVALYEGRELTADEQKALKDVLAKPGQLKEGSQQYDDACALMGAGYFNFFNDPKVSVAKFNGRDALILSDEDPRTKTVGQTIIVPSDKGQFLYAISFQGAQADFPAVKKGLDTIKWRPTPDAVAPPAPGPNRKK